MTSLLQSNKILNSKLNYLSNPMPEQIINSEYTEMATSIANTTECEENASKFLKLSESFKIISSILIGIYFDPTGTDKPKDLINKFSAQLEILSQLNSHNEAAGNFECPISINGITFDFNFNVLDLGTEKHINFKLSHNGAIIFDSIDSDIDQILEDNYYLQLASYSMIAEEKGFVNLFGIKTDVYEISKLFIMLDRITNLLEQE